MNLSRSLLPSIARVPTTASVTRAVISTKNVTLAGPDAEGETSQPFSVSHYIFQHDRHVYSRWMRLLHFEGDRLQVWDETGLCLHANAHVLLGRWSHQTFKGASSPPVADPTADMPSLWCYKESRYLRLLSIFMDKYVNKDTVFFTFSSLFLLAHPFHRLWFINGMDSWCRTIDFEVRRRVQEERRLIVLWHCVDVFLHSSHLTFGGLSVSRDGWDWNS